MDCFKLLYGNSIPLGLFNWFAIDTGTGQMQKSRAVS